MHNKGYLQVTVIVTLFKIQKCSFITIMVIANSLMAIKIIKSEVAINIILDKY